MTTVQDRIIRIAARATVKDGKIVRCDRDVLTNIARLTLTGDEERTIVDSIMYQKVVRFLSDIKTKRVREMNANQVQYIFAVVQHMKEMG